MSHLLIDRPSEFQAFLRDLSHASTIAYDTEFISEGRYFPQLCLIQIAAEGTLALIDPLAVDGLEALWELFCDREVVVHACRSEMEFCHRAIGRLPSKLFDVQLAAGFVGIDFPTGFRTLLDKLLGIDLSKAETRTDWNKRPLTHRQIEYALGDVRYLETMASQLKDRLRDAGRLEWYENEIAEIRKRLQHDFETPRWRNMPKTSSMKPRELAILREIWLWRDGLARQRNLPASRFLRDDLVVELAKRGTDDPQRITALRGLQRGDIAKILPGISAAVRHALDIPREQWPDMSDRATYPLYGVMTQILGAALAALCKREKIAPQLVGGPGDVRELIAAELGTLPAGVEVRLRSGWRAQMIGSHLTDILHGRTTLRLDPKQPDNPLMFD